MTEPRELLTGSAPAAAHAGATWWVCDATPGRKISALAPESEEEPLELPGPDEPLSFAEHIRPLFREIDRRSMRFAFDLWSHDDVAEHAQAIPERLRAGSMPCDGTWPERANSEAP